MFTVQCKEEDETFPDCEIPELKLLGYPSLELLLSSHRQLPAGLLKDFLYFQLFDALLGKNSRTYWDFVINEIGEVSAEANGYVLQGMGYAV